MEDYEASKEEAEEAEALYEELDAIRGHSGSQGRACPPRGTNRATTDKQDRLEVEHRDYADWLEELETIVEENCRQDDELEDDTTGSHHPG